MRAPFRVMAILYGVVVFVIVRSMELAAEQWTWLRAARWRRAASVVVAGGLIVMIFVEMQRPADANWSRDDLLPPALTAQVEPARAACDAVILLDDEKPDDPAWKGPVDAVVFATVAGLPTPQGYSRADPVDYPGPVGAGDGMALAQWMRNQGFTGRICAVTTSGVRVLSS